MLPLSARPSALALTLLVVAGTAKAQEAVPPEKPAAAAPDARPAAEAPAAVKAPPAVEAPPAAATESKPAATSGPVSPSAPAPTIPGLGLPPLPPMGPGAIPAPPGGPPPGLPGVPVAPSAPGTVAGSPPVGHPAIFRYYDKNGDQVLSPEELEKVPAPIREWIAKQKLDVTAGLKRDDFDANAPKLVDFLRARTAETILGPARLPSPGSQPSPSGGGNRSSRGGSSDFRALDLDQDAQLSFREWRAGKRLAADFPPRDVNGDGVVTSAEFDQTKDLAGSGAVASRPTTPGAPSPPGVSGPPGPITSPRPPVSSGPPGAAPSTPSSGSNLGTAASRQTFETLDRNKDGMVNPDEWSNSRRVGPGFKEKGIDISKNMTQSEFHTNYAKAFSTR